MELWFCIFLFVGFTAGQLVKGDCVQDDNACLRNSGCCSRNCSFNLQDEKLSCQPLFDDGDKTKVVDFRALKHRGIPHVHEAEVKGEEFKSNLFAAKSKLADLMGSVESIKENTKNELTNIVKEAADQIAKAKGEAGYNATCLDELQGSLTDSVNDATESAIQCSNSASTIVADMAQTVAKLDEELKAGIVESGQEIRRRCTKNAQIYRGQPFIVCARLAVSYAYDYLNENANLMNDHFGVFETLVVNAEECKQRAKATVETTRDKTPSEIETCKD